jgi:single-stranded-DNA-specific exonuclease
MKKHWIQKNINSENIEKIILQYQCSHLIASLIASRNLNSKEEVRNFFYPNENLLHDPFLMKGMEIAVLRIEDAIKNDEKILIYGDYDVDGTTSVALLMNFFSNFTKNISFYIPNRFSEGYGLSQKGIDYAIEQKVNLIITIDCGIQSVKLINEATKNNIDTIICDHHLPSDELPNAIAILNPKQEDCNYPYKELCGCGIGYKLITAFAIKYNIDEKHVNENIDLVATAIAADIVPMTGENRILASLGLKKANEHPCLALEILKESGKAIKKYTIRDLVFIISPRVNAAGRMDEGAKAVQLFMEKNRDAALEIASILQSDNQTRAEVDKNVTEEAFSILENNEKNIELKSTVVYQADWHKGVVGIVASRLMEKYYRPTLVLTSSNGKITGSARSIKGFNMYEGLSKCAEYLENFGGHYFAAGLTLNEENLIPFSNQFEKIVSESLSEEDFIPKIEVDASIDLNDIDFKLLNALDTFEPFGPQNMTPIFRTNGVVDFQGKSSVIKDKHIRFVIHQGNKIYNGIGFNLADKIDIIKNGTFDILYHLERNEWNGKETIQLKVIDIK